MRDRELRVGIVGAGHIAVTHARAWRRAPGCRWVGVHDVRPESARRLAARSDGVRVFEGLDDLLTSCDVVDVCTPPSTHPPIATAAIRAGRHLLVEKPLAVDLADWERLLERLDESSSRIAAVHNLKFTLGVRQARRWIESGRIGRPLRLERRFLTDPATDRMLAGKHWSHELPGGRWLETLPHELYLTHHLLGPLELAHVTARRSASAPVGAPADEVVILLEGADRMATIHYSANCRLNRRELTVYGSEGVIEVEILSDSASLTTAPDGPWRRALAGHRIDAARRLLGWVPDRLRYLGARVRGLDPHARLIDQFARHLHDEAPSPSPLEEIDYVIRMGARIGEQIDRRAASS